MEIKEVTIGVKMSKRLKKMLEKSAKKLGIKPSTLARELIIKHVGLKRRDRDV